MERYLGELLEELDKAYPNPIAIKELISKGFLQKLVLESLYKDLLQVPFDMGNLRAKANNNDTVPVTLSSNGFLMLNQIRLKKATEELNKSIKAFDKSSRRYSFMMVVLTVVLAILTALMLYKM